MVVNGNLIVVVIACVTVLFMVLNYILIFKYKGMAHELKKMNTKIIGMLGEVVSGQQDKLTQGAINKMADTVVNYGIKMEGLRGSDIAMRKIVEARKQAQRIEKIEESNKPFEGVRQGINGQKVSTQVFKPMPRKTDKRKKK